MRSGVGQLLGEGQLVASEFINNTNCTLDASLGRGVDRANSSWDGP